MKCPQCGSRRFRLGVVLAGEVTCQFDTADAMQVLQPATLESSWDPDARCSCLSCSWSGSAADAGLTDVAVEESAKFSGDDLQAIQRELQRADCPQELASAIQNLVETVQMLQNQLQIVRRMNRLKEPNELIQGDTTIF